MPNENQTSFAIDDIAINPGCSMEVIPHLEFPVDQLPAIEGGVDPTAEFLESVRGPGRVFQFLVCASVGGRMILKDGERRLKAARALGLATVPVLEMKVNSLRGSVLGLTLNNVRSPNPVSELRMISELISAGADEHTIAAVTHIPVATIRQRLQLLNLSEPLIESARDGAIRVSAAQKLAKLSKDEQAKAAQLLEEKGELTGADIAGIRRTAAAATAAQLPDELFADQTAVALEVWRENVANCLRQAIGMLPNHVSAGAVRAAIEGAIRAAEATSHDKAA